MLISGHSMNNPTRCNPNLRGGNKERQHQGRGLKTIPPTMTMPILRNLNARLRGGDLRARTAVMIPRKRSISGGDHLGPFPHRRQNQHHRRKERDGERVTKPEAPGQAHYLIPLARCNSRTYCTTSAMSPRVTPSTGGMLPKRQWCDCTPRAAAI